MHGWATGVLAANITAPRSWTASSNASCASSASSAGRSNARATSGVRVTRQFRDVPHGLGHGRHEARSPAAPLCSTKPTFCSRLRWPPRSGRLHPEHPSADSGKYPQWLTDLAHHPLVVNAVLRAMRACHMALLRGLLQGGMDPTNHISLAQVSTASMSMLLQTALASPTTRGRSGD